MSTQMDKDDRAWVTAISKLQDRIAQKLSAVGFHDQEGTIAHHLAEIAYLGGKLSETDLPAFLNLSDKDGDALGEVVVGMVYDLNDIKEAILELETTMVQLMNHLTQ